MAQAYNKRLGEAANRHLEAAEHLYKSTHRKDVAGYLYGIAAECALKQMMRDADMHPLSENKRHEDPFYAHFEALKTLLNDRLKGRCNCALIKFSSDDNFMQHWNIAMRYSDGKDIQSKWIEKWAENARQIISAMGT